MKQPVVLRIYKGDQLLGVKQFMESQIVIGREGEAQVLLESPAVAVIHAVIEEREGGGYYISDLGSETGTLRNGEKVLDSEIVTGDQLQIGEFKLEFYIGVPKPKAPPPPLVAAAVAAASAEVLAETTQVSEPKDNKDSAPIPSSPLISKPVLPVKPAVNPLPPKPSEEAVKPATPAPGTSVPPKAPPPSRSENQMENAEVTITSVPIDATPKSSAPIPTPRGGPPSPDAPKTFSIETSGPANKKSEPPAASIVTPTAVATGRVAVDGMVTTQKPQNYSGRKLPDTKPSAQSASGESHGRKHRWGKTFAPPSRFQSVNDYVRPSKGTVVEVLVCWRERIISSYHFSGQRVVSMGSHPDNDIVLPVFVSKVRKAPLLRLESNAVAFITPEMTGELTRGQDSLSFIELIRQNKMTKTGASYSLPLQQGEMLKIDLNDQISIVIRYVSDSPKPLMAPLLDLSTSEFTGVILSVVLVMILGLYMYIYVPPKGLVDPDKEPEPPRTAIFIANPPTPPPLPPPVKEVVKVEPTPPPPKVVKATPQPKKIEEKKAVTAPKAMTNLTQKQDNGKSANAAPNKNKTGPRTVTSPKQGGAIKTAAKEGSQMQSKKNVDVSKSGVFSAFGSGGAQDTLSQRTNGAGELAGMASAANGQAGSAVNRPGKGLGSELKDTGVGGTGKALEGIAGGISTTGRGGGNAGYGTGGLGKHTGSKIVTGGTEESFSGTIDREAIRRVIMNNLRVIKSCYERQLNRHPELSGKVVIGWEIGEQGRVVSAKVNSNELGSAEVGECIVEKLKSWRFPEPPSNQVVEVAYPFFFSN